MITPSVFAQEDGCGTGTVLVDGVCQLAPQESNDGCGTGTKMVNGVCQLDKSSGGSIQPGYIAAGAAAIGAAIIGIIFVVRRGSSGTSTPKPARQDLEDYEDQYLRRQGQRPTRKPAETRPDVFILQQLWKTTKANCKVLWQVWIQAITICYNFVIENCRNHYYREKTNHNYWN